jgi:hypothetical protein
MLISSGTAASFGLPKRCDDGLTVERAKVRLALCYASESKSKKKKKEKS